jgi:hypothetical protein
MNVDGVSRGCRRPDEEERDENKAGGTHGITPRGVRVAAAVRSRVRCRRWPRPRDPHVAELLASRGWFVIGFDSRAYLSSVAEANQVLSVTDIPRDDDALVSLAGTTGVKPLLIGISEGARLSAAAAVDPAVKREIGGVVAIGLGDNNELAWHMRDAIIYLTKGIPREPLFHATDIVGEVSPVPIAMLGSTGDEFVKPEESDRLIRAAREPKSEWTISASDHRFSNNLKEFDVHLLDAIAWMVSAARSR